MSTNTRVSGFSAMVAAATLSRLLLPRLDLTLDPEFRLVAAFFIGAVVGALVAREKFLLPALGAWVFFWSCYAGIVSANGQSLLSVMSERFDTMALSAGAVVCGVLLVQSLFILVRASFRAKLTTRF